MSRLMGPMVIFSGIFFVVHGTDTLNEGYLSARKGRVDLRLIGGRRRERAQKDIGIRSHDGDRLLGRVQRVAQ